jgi:Ca2+-transporting ATPase
MALGVVRMSKENMLVRTLPAVESLGGVSVICTDKTGTLTKNQISTVALANFNDIDKKKYIRTQTLNDFSDYQELVNASVLCNNATYDPDHANQILGDPTEGALLILDKNFLELRKRYIKVYEQPFDSDRKLMSTIHQIDNRYVIYTKGAIEELLKHCTSVYSNNQIIPISESIKIQINESSNHMMFNGLRAIGLAFKPTTQVPQEQNVNVEHELCFLGLVGMIDPIREEVKPVILECQNAGIKTVMITGDHQVTAVAIAKQLNIYRDNSTVINGHDLAAMTDAQLKTAVVNTAVFARVSPKDKLRIVKTYQDNNEVVAMTGDGVNDAPALKAANVGVSMGKTGTDVAKGAADLLLLDDNFTTIAKAVREGRKIYQNILKLIMFLIAGNIAEIIVLTLATLVN